MNSLSQTTNSAPATMPLTIEQMQKIRWGLWSQLFQLQAKLSQLTPTATNEYSAEIEDEIRCVDANIDLCGVAIRSTIASMPVTRHEQLARQHATAHPQTQYSWKDADGRKWSVVNWHGSVMVDLVSYCGRYSEYQHVTDTTTGKILDSYGDIYIASEGLVN